MIPPRLAGRDPAGGRIGVSSVFRVGLTPIVFPARFAAKESIGARQVLYASRLPYAMARDGWLPSALARTSQRTGVPTVALVATCLVSALCAALPFGKLVVLDILLYSAGLALEFAALMVLRIRRPDLARPSRVPGGRLGLAWAALAPLMFATVVTVAAWRGEGAVRLQLLIATLAITGGVLLYYSRRRGRRDRPEQDSESPG